MVEKLQLNLKLTTIRKRSAKMETKTVKYISLSLIHIRKETWLFTLMVTKKIKLNKDHIVTFFIYSN